MSKYTWKDVLDAQYAAQFYDSLQKRIDELETENKHLRAALSIRTINEKQHRKPEVCAAVAHQLIPSSRTLNETEAITGCSRGDAPIPHQNNSTIDLHLPKDEQP